MGGERTSDAAAESLGAHLAEGSPIPFRDGFFSLEQDVRSASVPAKPLAHVHGEERGSRLQERLHLLEKPQTARAKGFSVIHGSPLSVKILKKSKRRAQRTWRIKQ